MSVAAALVLRDRTNADAHQVLSHAMDELVAGGAWRTGRAREGLRRVATLAPASDGAAATTSAALHEPLRGTDRLLRRIASDLGTPFGVPAAARWVAARDTYAADEILRGAIEDLVARGLLERVPVGEAIVEGKPIRTTRLAATAAGEAWLAAHPPPAAVRPGARDDRRRAAGLRALSPLGAAFTAAWLAAPTGVGGFAFGAVGARDQGDGAAGGYADGVAYGSGGDGGSCPPTGGSC